MEDLRKRLFKAIFYHDTDGVSQALAQASPSVAAAAVDSLDPKRKMKIQSRTWPITPLSSAVRTGRHNLVKIMVQYRSREAALKTTWSSTDTDIIEVDTWWLPFRALLGVSGGPYATHAVILDKLACDLSDLVTGAEQELGRLLWLWAARRNVDWFIEALLEAGFPINLAYLPTRGDDDRIEKDSPYYHLPQTALLVASASGADRVVDVLLRRGAAVSSASKKLDDDNPQSHLFAAARGLEDVIRLSSVFDLDVFSHWVKNVKIKSTDNKYTRIIHALLDNGEDPNPERIDDGYSGRLDHVIHLSTSFGMVSVVERLLEARPQMEISCYDGKTLLHHAIRSGNLEMVAKVLELSRLSGNSTMISSGNERDPPPIVFCVVEEDPEILRLLLDSGFDPNAQTREGITGLLLATSLNRLDMVRELLDKQADPDLTLAWESMSELKGSLDWLPYKYQDMVAGSPLLSAFAQLEQAITLRYHKGGFRASRIQDLRIQSTVEIIKMLLISKASMIVPSFVATKKFVQFDTTQYDFSDHPDAWSVSQSYPYECALRTISNVGSQDVPHWELSPSEYVSLAHHVVDAIQASFQPVIPPPVLDSCLRTVCSLTMDSDNGVYFHGLYSAVERLLDLGADAQVQLPYGATLLHICNDSIGYETSHEDRESVVRGRIRRLLSLGIPVNIMDDQGRTPLHYAALRHEAAVSELLDDGANPLSRDSTTPESNLTMSGEELGLTALDLSVSSSRIDIPEAIKALLLHTPSDKINWGRLFWRSCASKAWTNKIGSDGINSTPAEQEAMDWILAVAQAANPMILLQHDENGDTPLHIACGANSLLALRAICKIHAPWQLYCMQDSMGRTPLMRVLVRRDKSMTLSFLEEIIGGISKTVAIPDISFTETLTSNLDKYHLHAETHFNFSRHRLQAQKTLPQPLPYDHLLPENLPFQAKKDNLRPLPDNNMCSATAEQRAHCFNMCDDAGWTALHYAIAANSIDVLGELLGVSSIVVEETSCYGAPSPMELAKLTGEQHSLGFGRTPNHSILLILRKRKNAEVSMSASSDHSDDSDGDDGGVYLSNVPIHRETEDKAVMATHTHAQSSYSIWFVRLACLFIIVFASMYLILRIAHRN